MSLTFAITPPKRFLRRHRPMAVGEVLVLREADLLLPAGQDDREQIALWQSPLADGPVLAGSSGQSGRGFELSYGDGAYQVRQFTPSTMTDFDARADVIAGLRTMSAREQGDVRMPGYLRPVTFTAQTWQRILEADDPAAAFSEEFGAVQRVDAFDASPRVRTDAEGEAPVGVYALTEGIDTVLPREPGTGPELREESGGAVSSWELVLLVGEDDPEPVASVPFEDGLRRLPAQKVHDLDAASLLVDALDEQEIRQVAGLGD